MLRNKLLTVCAAILLFLPFASPAYGQQSFANGMIRSVSSPDIQPGQRGTLNVEVQNVFNSSITEVLLTLTVYAFVDGSSYVPVPSSSVPSSRLPYFIGTGQPAETLTAKSIGAGALHNFTFPFQTDYNTLHGTFFNEGAYMVSMSLTFLIVSTVYRMASKGYFSPAQWQKIYVQNGSSASLNYTYLNNTLGFAGILPDTSFGVNTPAPWSIFFASGVLAAGFAAAAALSFRRTHRRKRS